jgi:hypothetical protein
MENLRKWVMSNLSTIVLTVLFIMILVNPDAKAWLMRQVASTGILNSSISKKVKPGSTAAYTFDTEKRKRSPY